MLSKLPEKTTAADLDRYMPVPAVSVSTALFPSWTSMRACMYRLPPGEVTLPAVENLRMSVQLSACSSNVARTLGGVLSKAQPGLGSVNFIPANHPIHWHWDGYIEFLQMQLSGDFLSSIKDEYGIDAQRILSLDLLNVRDPIIAQIAHKLTEIMQSEQQGMGTRYLDSMATSLALHLQQRYVDDNWIGKDGGQSQSTDFSLVVEYIHDNLDKDLRVDQVAKIANLSNFYFIKLFKSTFGKPPHQYILGCRVELAKRLLIETSLPISEISQRCGFATQSHFTNVFHRYAGSAPRAFRQANGSISRKS
jgi:AraC family transcriptional regulator